MSRHYCQSCGIDYETTDVVGHDEGCSWYEIDFAEVRLLDILKKEFNDSKIELIEVGNVKYIMFEGHRLNCHWSGDLIKDRRIVGGVDPILDMFYSLRNQINNNRFEKSETKNVFKVFKSRKNNSKKNRKEYLIQKIKEVYPFSKFEFKTECLADFKLYSRLYIDDIDTGFCTYIPMDSLDLSSKDIDLDGFFNEILEKLEKLQEDV